jgi:Nucleoside H+ symporter
VLDPATHTSSFLIAGFGVYLWAPLVFQFIPGYLETQGLPPAGISLTMTLGQLTEIGLLAVLPWLWRRFGAKGSLTLGIGAWSLRFLSRSHVFR